MSYTLEKDAEGKDYVILKKFTFDYDVKDNAHVYLTNLLNGKKELSDAMLKFLNESLREVIVDYRRPLMDVTNKKIFKNVKTFLLKNAISDIAFNYLLHCETVTTRNCDKYGSKYIGLKYYLRI